MTEEKQGAAEWLREKAQSVRRAKGFGCKELMASEFGESCDGRRCADCYADLFERIADRIDADRELPDDVEWSRFEDGELVRAGDEVEFKGEAKRCYSVTFTVDGWSLWFEFEGLDGRLCGKYGERVKRPAPKVLDADGVSINVGDTVYFVGGSGTRFAVKDIDFKPDGAFVDIIDEDRYSATVNPESLTHERPDSWERIEEDAKLAPRDYLEKRGMNPEKTERIASMMADIVSRAKALAKAGEVE